MTSQVFLGLTLSCARCHDHKYDPITMEDYYALAGVFASTMRAERPLFGEQGSRDQIEAGLQASGKVLSFLDGVAGEGAILNGGDITLADYQLAPMIDYFVRAEEGKAALASRPALQRWWERVSALGVLGATDPFAAARTRSATLSLC